MITKIEALNFRCLSHVSRAMSGFHVLVGANASGKTTFLDVIGFLHDIVDQGLEKALEDRTTNPEELLYRRRGNSMELCIEALIPDALRKQTEWPELDTARYEVAIGFDEAHQQFAFLTEKLLLKKNCQPAVEQRVLFPAEGPGPETLITTKGQTNTKLVLNKVPGGNDSFYSEVARDSEEGWAPSLRLGPMKSALQNLPADEAAMPVANWFRSLLGLGVQRFILNSQAIRRPSPPTKIKGFLPDGSNLPWVVARLRKSNKDRFKSWISHMQTALTDLVDIDTIERSEDKHRYLVFEYTGGLKVPSWFCSDGTLRLTALTLPAYLDDLQGIYLIEEPENGIHPKAVATVFNSLSSVYSAQVLMASHSPIVLNAAKAGQVLCFAKNDAGATDIVSGDEHPRLKQWRGEAGLGMLLAAGVLG